MYSSYVQKALMLLAFLLTAAVSAQTVWDGSADTAWFAASGGAAKTYVITTAEQLAGLAKLVNGGKNMAGCTIVLGDYVALNNTADWRNWGAESHDGAGLRQWTAIGRPSSPFRGTFDGGLFVVRGVYINKEGATDSAGYQGLFGYVNGGGEIKRARVAESYIRGHRYVGALVGKDSGGAITDCYATGNVVGTGGDAGALAGWHGGAAVRNSYATGNASGQNNVGGLIGTAVNDTVENCYAAGAASGIDSVGGLIGRDSGYTVIANVYAAGNVTGSGGYVGGLAGVGHAEITNSYALGKVSGGTGGYVGGLAGLKRGAPMRGCYAAGSVAGNGATVGAVVGAKDADVTLLYNYYNRDSANTAGSAGSGRIPKSTAEMTSAEFVRLLNISAYALSAKKWIRTEKYPALSGDQNAELDFPAGFAEGNGSERFPLVIDTLRHLEDIAILVNCGASLSGMYFKLGRSIYINRDTASWKRWGSAPPAYEWTAIGRRDAQFDGALDGGGFAIGGVYVNKTDPADGGGHQGLFGRLGKNASVKNLRITHSHISGYGYVGALAGWNEGTVRSVAAAANVSASGGSGAGGLIGVNRGDSITSCSAAGEVTGTADAAGGLVGRNTAGSKIQYCHAAVNVAVDGDDVGGLVGRNDSGAVITNCYAVGNVSGGTGDAAGGLAGANVDATVTTCYAAGKVSSGNSSIGGLIGLQRNGAQTDSCYYKRDPSITENGLGAPRTDEEMKQRDTYKGWNFNRAWDINPATNNGYPHFAAGYAAPPIAVLSSDKVIIPNQPGELTAQIAPPSPSSSITTELTIGPNPAAKQLGCINFYRQGKRVDDAVLSIYDAAGNVVKRVRIVDGGDNGGNGSTRKVGSWDLTDERGRKVQEGAYLVRGEVVGKDGKRGRVSAVVGVR